MSFLLKSKQYCALGVLSSLVFSVNAGANPWLDAGDMKLRHELQLLSDSGVLDAPTTTWPLLAEDIHRSLEKSTDKKSTLEPELLDILANINQSLAVNKYGSKVEVLARSKKILVRDFSGEGREKGSISYDGGWGNRIGDVRLKASLSTKSDHPSDQNVRLDESYIASSLGNWKFTVGKQSRWWGPSWDGSLILSNNARPIPSLSVENINSKAFSNKWMHWLGPNKMHMFVGQLESDRHVPNAKFIGTRFTFKPFNSLEVGMHRTIQWGGEGENNDFSDLLKTILSIRVSNPNGNLGTVRGNQIAGLDARWSLPIRSKNKYSLYGQYIGEDRVDGSLLLGDETFLFGGSVSGLSKNGSWRTYIEATDTSAAWFKGRARNNTIYRHGTYKDGYRHQGVSMGHGIDSDSQIFSVGAMLSQNNGDFWRGWIKHTKLNLDGIGDNPAAGENSNGKKWSAIGVSLDKKLSKQSKLNLGLQFTSETETGKSRYNDFGASVGYSYTF
ncbi:MAG: capsule assembly Wzi family protein [Cocleimonas sp.]